MDMHRNQRVPSPLPAQTIAGSATGASDGVIFPSASRTNATYTSDPIYNANACGVKLFIDATNVGAGPGTLTVSVEQQDPVSGNWVPIPGATTAALNAVQTKTLTVYPGITAAAGSATTSTDVNNVVGCVWRVKVVVATNAVVFSVGAEYLTA